ncbi:MAG: DUF1398 family protein [Candidatus Micrarchaeota archaeon]|nr:DUF1398 family protein [Candidatus Micrarchaeota archaeon]
MGSANRGDGMDMAALEKTLKAGAEGKIGYAQLLSNLAQAGVDGYEVDVGVFRCVYNGGGQTYEEEGHDFPPLKVADVFDPALIAQAIAANHAKPDYRRFLQGIARAGVVRYAVDTRKRTIAYRGAKAEIYQENIPRP